MESVTCTQIHQSSDITSLQELNRIITAVGADDDSYLKEILEDHNISTSTGGDRSTSCCVS